MVTFKGNAGCVTPTEPLQKQISTLGEGVGVINNAPGWLVVADWNLVVLNRLDTLGINSAEVLREDQFSYAAA